LIIFELIYVCRSGFFIHGNSINNSDTTHNGCIILGLKYRELMWDSKDKDLLVITV